MSEENTPKKNLKRPMRVVLGEDEIISMLGEAYEATGYHLCKGELANWTDLGEKTATVILCGNGIPCVCNQIKEESAALAAQHNAVTSPNGAMKIAPEDDLFED